MRGAEKKGRLPLNSRELRSLPAVSPHSQAACPPALPAFPRLTRLIFVDAQSRGDALEGALVTGSYRLGRIACSAGALGGGHQRPAAGEALAEPGEEQPELEGEETKQREDGEKRIREIVEIPLVRRSHRRLLAVWSGSRAGG